MTPIDTDRVTGVLATHGVSCRIAPASSAATPAPALATRSCAAATLNGSWGRASRSSGSTRSAASTRCLGSVSAGVAVPRGDVVNIRMQNGGGYGDPLDREVTAVLRDVLDGKVTPDAARAIYGVVVDREELDTAATTARRAAIRQHRAEAMRRPLTQHAGGGRNIPLRDAVGRFATPQRHADRTRVHCAHCNGDLGELTGDWRDVAGVIAVAGAELGPYVEIHEDLVANQYVCPNCASLLWVEVIGAEGAPVPDFALDD